MGCGIISIGGNDPPMFTSVVGNVPTTEAFSCRILSKSPPVHPQLVDKGDIENFCLLFSSTLFCVKMKKNNKNMKNKKYIYFAIIISVIIITYFIVTGGGRNDEDIFVVTRGTISEEIFETGVVKRGENIVLSFKESGRVDLVFASENETAEKGDVLAVLERGVLDIQLKEAEESRKAAQASLQRLLAGSREEEINVVHAVVSSAQSALYSAERSLSDVKRTADDTLLAAYKDVPTQISSVYMDVMVTFEIVEDFVDNYFIGFLSSETIKGRSGRDKISFALSGIREYRDIVGKEVSFNDQDTALLRIREALSDTLSGLEDILIATESDFYKDRILSTDVDALRLRRTKTVADLNIISSLIQNVSHVRNSSKASINAALAIVSSAQSNLDRAEKDLQRVSASPLLEEVEIQESAVRRAEANIALLNERLKDLSLIAPFSGRITDVFGKRGEIFSAGVPFLSFSSDDLFYIEAYIYERDIVRINIGDPVKINLVPFPNKTIKGEIFFINESGKLINNVVYYEIKVSMGDVPPRTMVEMTADMTITGMKKEDVFIVPDRYLQRRDGKRIAKVFVDGEIEERVVGVGIRAADGMVEVISGLKEGDIITL